MVSTVFPLYKTIDNTRFSIEIAKTNAHRQAVYAMRYQIFNTELQQGLQASVATALDQDQYDAYCEQLVVINDQGRIVGTCRLLPYALVKSSIGLYSENEFNLLNIYQADLPLLEVGRVCVDSNYRNRSVINLLWLGVVNYMHEHQLRYACGCASLDKKHDGAFASMIYQYFKNNAKLLCEDFQISAHDKNKVPNFNAQLDINNVKNVKRKIPHLLRAYFFLNAKIGSEPAYDPEFGVIDFFVFLDLATMSKSGNFKVV